MTENDFVAEVKKSTSRVMGHLGMSRFDEMDVPLASFSPQQYKDKVDELLNGVPEEDRYITVKFLDGRRRAGLVSLKKC
jgi:hypothetical protein